MRKHLLRSVLLMAATVMGTAAPAANIGYSNGTVGRAYLFRLGNTDKQGMAIRLGSDKLKELKGATISGIQTVFGSRNTTGKTAHLFVATSPEGKALTEQDVTISTVTKWADFTLTTPYTITGEEGELYIGYTADIDSHYSLLSSDKSNDTKGVNYAYKDGEWTDLYGTGLGCVSVRAIVSDAPAFNDAMLKTLSFDGYYKVGNDYQFAGQMFNFGTETITSLDVTLKAGAGEPVTQTISGLSIAPGATYDITFPTYTPQEEGSLNLSLTISKVNGLSDSDATDNEGATTLYFYPKGMERSLLLEGFTGQSCSNCPAGHTAINSFLGSTTESVVEVMHHVGYEPDRFAMAQSDAYRVFFNSATSYAPAFMMNRAIISGLNTQPVMNTGTEYMTSAAQYLSTKHRPYVSLKLESQYDETSREMTTKLTVYAHENLPEGQNVLNVYLVQNNIIAPQTAGGTNYNHSMVFRGALTGNAWGMLLPTDMQAGDSATWEKTSTLSETIFSDYWTNISTWANSYYTYTQDDLNVPTDPANTYIVAYVGGFGGSESIEGHEVYNCTQVKLGQSHTQSGLTGIQAVSNGDSRLVPTFSVEGRRVVATGCDHVAVYNMAGQQMPAGADLTQGLYIVRATAAGKTTAKKIIIK